VSYFPLFSCIREFFNLRAACGGAQKKKKEFFGDTPNPGRRLRPLHSRLFGDIPNLGKGAALPALPAVQGHSESRQGCCAPCTIAIIPIV
jgi:hypothetical protein